MQRVSWRMALCCGIGLFFGLLTITPFASATIYTYSATANPNAAPDANGNTDVWSFSATTGNTSQAGDFLGNSGNNGDGNGAGAGTSAWAMYANSGQTARSSADISALTGAALSFASQYVSLDFDNGYIDSGNSVGIKFLNSSGAVQLAFEFVGGDTYYKVTDSTGAHSTSPTLGFTDDGFNVKLTLNHNSSGQYTFKAGPSFSISGVLQQSTSQIAKIEVFNSNAGGGSSKDMFFNNLVVSTAVPEVPAGVLFAVVGSVIMGANELKSLRRARHTASKSASPAI